MMRMSNIQMETIVDKATLLATIKKNYEKHSRIVAEARVGYITKAREALEARLKLLQEGKLASLSFNLTPPADYSEVYRSCINMLEWNTQEKITLKADEFRQLVLDEWDWKHQFYHTNMAYSAEAVVDFNGISGAREDT